jgi:hypothetical protein
MTTRRFPEFRRQRDRSAAEHRVARVQNQIGENLLQFSGVAENFRRRRGVIFDDFDRDFRICGSSSWSVSSSSLLTCRLREIGRISRARKIQKIAGDVRSAFGLFLNFQQKRVFRIGFGNHSEQHLRVARNARQRRVDFVRDAGREQPDARKFFALLQSFFELDARSDVFEHDDRARLLCETERSGATATFKIRFAVRRSRVKFISVTQFGQMPARFAQNAFEIERETSSKTSSTVSRRFLAASDRAFLRTSNCSA